MSSISSIPSSTSILAVRCFGVFAYHLKGEKSDLHTKNIKSVYTTDVFRRTGYHIQGWHPIHCFIYRDIGPYSAIDLKSALTPRLSYLIIIYLFGFCIMHCVSKCIKMSEGQTQKPRFNPQLLPPHVKVCLSKTTAGMNEKQIFHWSTGAHHAALPHLSIIILIQLHLTVT